MEQGGIDFTIQFTRSALIDTVAAWSHGIPRLINAICDNALLIAFSETTRTVETAPHPGCMSGTEFANTRQPAKPRAVAPVAPVLARPVEEISLLPSSKTAPERVSDSGPTLWVESRPSLLKKWPGDGVLTNTCRSLMAKGRVRRGNGRLSYHRLLNGIAKRVSQQDMTLLNPWGFIGRHSNEYID